MVRVLPNAIVRHGLRLGGGRVASAFGPPESAHYDEDWSDRVAVRVANSNGATLADFQVNIVLDADQAALFAGALADGSDLRVTDTDGTTLLPYWIESFDAGTETASIWARVPSVAAGTDWLWLYWGNATPALVEIPPLGPWVKDAANPLLPRTAGTGKLPENTVWDATTAKYWMTYTDREHAGGYGRIGMMSSADAVTWVDEGVILTYAGAPSADSPHLIKDGATWYLFFHSTSVYYATATDVNGPYGAATEVLAPTPATWDKGRVTEVFVFLDGATWRMLYMGDAADTAVFCGGETSNAQEQIGLATAPAITGPWTKSPLNPIIPYGGGFSGGAWDSCIVADPWAYKFGDDWIIGYAGVHGVTTNAKTGYATTTDWVTYEPGGLLLGPSSTPVASADDAWDDNNVFRGAVFRYADTYGFWFVGQNTFAPLYWQGGLATQSAKGTIAGYPPEQVFGLYETFSVDGVLPNQWHSRPRANTYTVDPDPANAADAVVSGGVLTLTSGRDNPGFRLVSRVRSTQEFGPGWMAEVRARHSSAAGTAALASAVGFGYHDTVANQSAELWSAGGSGFSGAANFRNNSQRVRIPTDPSLAITGHTGTGTPITVDLWAYLLSNTAGNTFIVARKAPGATANWTISLTGNGAHAGKIGVAIGGTTVQTTANSITAADLNAWMLLSFTYETDGATGTLTIYKNGVAQAHAGTVSAALATTADIYVGQRGDDIFWLDGLVDELRISDVNRYSGDFTPVAAPFVADADTAGLWRFDDAAGSVVTDASGNANHGAIEGTSGLIAVAAGANANWLKTAGYGHVRQDAMASAYDAASYHTFGAWWRSADSARFRIDGASWEEVTASVPPATATLPVWLSVEAAGDNASNGTLLVDWVRVRKMADTEPTVTVLTAESSVPAGALLHDGEPVMHDGEYLLGVP